MTQGDNSHVERLIFSQQLLHNKISYRFATYDFRSIYIICSTNFFLYIKKKKNKEQEAQRHKLTAQNFAYLELLNFLHRISQNKSINTAAAMVKMTQLEIINKITWWEEKKTIYQFFELAYFAIHGNWVWWGSGRW